MKVTIQTTDKSFYSDLKSQNIEGLTLKAVTKDSLSEFSTVVLTILVSFLTPVAGELFKEWLANKLKDKPEEKTVINGNQINIENVNITYISNAVEGKLPNNDHKTKSDDSES